MPDPIVSNALLTLVICDPVAEFSELSRDEKSTDLPTLREPMKRMQHAIDIKPNSECRPRFLCSYNQFKDHITEKIIPELATVRIVL